MVVLQEDREFGASVGARLSKQNKTKSDLKVDFSCAMWGRSQLSDMVGCRSIMGLCGSAGLCVFLRSHLPWFLGPETHQLQGCLVGKLVFLPPSLPFTYLAISSLEHFFKGLLYYSLFGVCMCVWAGLCKGAPGAHRGSGCPGV